tara:strand:- start:2671 stop:2973 length:303 start_codon:yes stop_codon:yes gene_type:complete
MLLRKALFLHPDFGLRPHVAQAIAEHLLAFGIISDRGPAILATSVFLAVIASDTFPVARRTLATLQVQGTVQERESGIFLDVLFELRPIEVVIQVFECHR